MQHEKIKITNSKAIAKRQFKYLDISDTFKDAFGKLTVNFSAIIWGQSGNGKSNLVMQFAAELLNFGPVLYVSLEEKRGATIQTLILRYIPEDKRKLLKIAHANANYESLVQYISRPRTPKFIIIDSVQYLDIDYTQYKRLREQFSRKAFIFISHAKGSLPDGKTADKIRYDVDLKIFVRHDIGFVKHSRYGGHKNFVIYEAGAKKAWKKKFKSLLNR